jgi:hypothetical protein
MIPVYVVIALVIGASTGAVIVLIASRGQSHLHPRDATTHDQAAQHADPACRC